MAFASEQRNATFATINITPLVDVMLVLLVIFMIAAPVLTRTIDLKLPGAMAPSSAIGWSEGAYTVAEAVTSTRARTPARRSASNR